MPRGLKRHQEARDLYFITFSCYHRQPLLANPSAMHQFEVALALGRGLYDFYVAGDCPTLAKSRLERGTQTVCFLVIGESGWPPAKPSCFNQWVRKVPGCSQIA